MMYPYITLADETLITHSHLMGKGEDKCVKVHFERPKPYGFDSVTYLLPSYKQTERIGYSDEEIKDFEKLLRRAAHSFFRYAEMGGLDIAKTNSHW
ncbi:MAG: PcfB family protein [Oscillospiraceae bacterium]|nr:PcfB family protein [Oscillospiraceae bacterium]